MNTLFIDKENLFRTINKREFNQQSLLEKCNTLACVVNFLDKYQLSNLRYECALLRYFITLENENISLSEKCERILDIAESFVNYGYAILAMRIVKSVLELNCDLDDYITAKAYYYNGVAFKSLDYSILALKEFEKAENIVKNSNHLLLLSQIYCQMGRAFKSHPSKRKKKKAVEYYKRSIEIKENELGKPFSIIDDYLYSLLCIEKDSDFHDHYNKYVDYLINNSYEKHFSLIWYYKAKAYRTNGNEADKFFALANECSLYKYVTNKNITTLTNVCKDMGWNCFEMKKYELAIMFFNIVEKLYRYWKEQDYGDMLSVYQWLCRCYNEIGDKQKAKEYLKLSKRQISITKTFSTTTQFLNITKDSINDYLKTLFVSEIHKGGFGLENLNEYASQLFQRIFEMIGIMEKSQYKIRTFDDCCGEMLFEIGKTFCNGEYNIESDYEYSNHIYKKAADLGYISAKFTLLKETCETEASIDEMVNLMKSAFKAGYFEAGRFLGILTSDIKEKFHYYTVAAENGDSDAKYSLGLMYRDGIGVEKNIAKAVKLWEEASDQNNSDAITEMGLVYKSENVLFDLGCEPYDFNFVEKDKNKAFECFMKAAKLGNARSQVMLGQLYMKDSTMKDLSSAEYWLSKSAEQNYALAMLSLAQLYSSKTDINYFNYEDAVFWFDKTYFTFISSTDEFEHDIAEEAKNLKDIFVSSNFWH